MTDKKRNYARGIPVKNAGRMRTNASYSFSDRWGSGQASREDLGQSGKKGDSLPNLWDAVGYPSATDLDFKTYYDRYERDGVAQALIDRPVEATWQEPPQVEDSGHPEDADEDDESKTPFERDVQSLMAGDTLRRSPLHRLTVAHKMAALGNYSIIVLGFGDQKDLSTPVDGVKESVLAKLRQSTAAPPGTEDGGGSGEGGQQSSPDTSTDTDAEADTDAGAEGGMGGGAGTPLHYVSVFAQDRVKIKEKVTDMTKPRFRMPKTYEVRVSSNPDRQSTDGSQDVSQETKDEEDEKKEVHWTRVIHIPQGTQENDLKGPSELKAVFNYLLNIDKILAGSAEGYWRNGFTPFHIKPPAGSGGQLQTGMTDMRGGGELATRIGRLINNAQRTIATNAELEPVNLTVENPEPHFQMQIRAISAEKNFPQSYLMGNETGERASREDRHIWDREIESIRTQYAGAVIFKPFINRLIAAGTIRPPVGGGYDLSWSELNTPSEHERAETAKLWMQSIKIASGGHPTMLYSPAELRQKLGDDPRIGSEAELSTEEQAQERANQEALAAIDESDPAVQAQAEDMGLGSGSSMSSDMQTPSNQPAVTDGGSDN